jgi:hypothetical protein
MTRFKIVSLAKRARSTVVSDLSLLLKVLSSEIDPAEIRLIR